MSVFALMKTQFAESAKALKRTQTLTTVGVLLAIQMLLSSFGVFQLTESVKISLAHLALAPTAMLFGPVAAGIQGALSDFLGYLLKPTGPYFPGFTLTAMLLGIIYGMLLYRTKRSLWQIILARVIVALFLNICLNTVFLAMLYGPAQWAALPLRATKNFLQLPIDCVLLSAVCRAVSRIPLRTSYR
ncbi:MAG: folate family ECF transporter S component [Clostridia bacterium]|nr:folate family ECF transporter S component [Clostridia bacterium]